MLKKHIAGVLLFAALFTLPQNSFAGPITFVTALPVAKGQGVFRAQSNSALSNSSTSLISSVVFAYGATEKLSLFANLPNVYGSQQSQLGGKSVTRNHIAAGDLLLYARYQLVHKNWFGKTFRITPIVGTYLPTGSYLAEDQYGRLPNSLQTGSGTASPYVATALTAETLKYEYNADITYRYNPGTKSYRLGNEMRTDLSFQRRLLPWRLGDGVPNFLYFILETNYLQDGISHLGGTKLNGTGGSQWLLDPGLNFAAERWQMGAVAQIEIHQTAYLVQAPSRTVGAVGFFQYYFGLPSIGHMRFHR